MKYKLIKNSWNDITINDYQHIVEIAQDESLSETEKNIEVLSILIDVPSEELYQIEISELQDLIDKIDWMNKFDFDKDVKFNTINIGKYNCKVNVDLQKFTIAQYVDFQTYYSKGTDKNLVEIISCFLVPLKCKYADGYDVLDLQNEIKNNMNIKIANSIMFFFAKKSLISINNMLQSSLPILKKQMKQTKDEKEKNKLKTLINQINHLFG